MGEEEECKKKEAWISFRPMVNVAVRKVYYADCILVKHFKLMFILKAEEPPACIPCNEVLTVEHISINCVDLQEYRNWCCSIRLLFRECFLGNIVEFLIKLQICCLNVIALLCFLNFCYTRLSL